MEPQNPDTPELTVGELIGRLSALDQTATVRPAVNPLFPMAHRVSGVMAARDEAGRPLVLLADGDQTGHVPPDVAIRLTWHEPTAAPPRPAQGGPPLAAPVQATPHPLRTTRRPPPGPAPTRLQHYLPPTTPNLILKRSASDLGMGAMELRPVSMKCGMAEVMPCLAVVEADVQGLVEASPGRLHPRTHRPAHSLPGPPPRPPLAKAPTPEHAPPRHRMIREVRSLLLRLATARASRDPARTRALIRERDDLLRRPSQGPGRGRWSGGREADGEGPQPYPQSTDTRHSCGATRRRSPAPGSRSRRGSRGRR
ncbi:hypothetical protein SSCG_03500 [Streptomyces clavuligerus]|nr:hypothetical protein SSCG_03500 [Streptomyces clavuligerus]